ncbi:hypothetical protein GGI12_005495 [Dipsacomyces acuminosporus]|nr:hypothetical protein GGI12_005495 [Dipsacomyces acuminosporus]
MFGMQADISAFKKSAARTRKHVALLVNPKSELLFVHCYDYFFLMLSFIVVGVAMLCIQSTIIAQCAFFVFSLKRLFFDPGFNDWDNIDGFSYPNFNHNFLAKVAVSEVVTDGFKF